MKKKFLSVLLALCMVAGTATASPEQMSSAGGRGRYC